MAAGQLKLDKADVRRAFAAYHFEPTTLAGAFDRLRSVQYDPLAPVGRNHDLVLQARVPGYKIGDWQEAAYRDRIVFDGWDKQACLISASAWPLRRIYHHWNPLEDHRVFKEHEPAVSAVLAEITERGPLTPRDFEFQEHKAEWKGSWYGPSLTKQALRALWNSGRVMTHSRRSGQHVYDLAERIVPDELRETPMATEFESVKGIVLERHRAVGIVRPSAPFEVWSMQRMATTRRTAIAELVEEGALIPVDIDGTAAHATPSFIEALDSAMTPKVRFIAPLDQIMWDRKTIAHVFGFDYVWEVYKPEKQRQWGYYVLPVMFGDRFVGRVELWSRAGVLEFRVWHWELGEPSPEFWPAFEEVLAQFMNYCQARSVTCARSVDKRLAQAGKTVAKSL